MNRSVLITIPGDFLCWMYKNLMCCKINWFHSSYGQLLSKILYTSKKTKDKLKWNVGHYQDSHNYKKCLAVTTAPVTSPLTITTVSPSSENAPWYWSNKFNGLKHVGLEINEADCMTFLLTCKSRLCQGLVVHSTAVTLSGYDRNKIIVVLVAYMTYLLN